eukprot:643361-Pleurochrysis_carterae.AAC.1
MNDIQVVARTDSTIGFELHSLQSSCIDCGSNFPWRLASTAMTLLLTPTTFSGVQHSSCQQTVQDSYSGVNLNACELHFGQV